MRRIQTVVVIFWGLLVGGSASGKTVSGDVSELRAIINANNKAVAAAKAEVAAAAERRGSLMRSFLPEMGFHGGRKAKHDGGFSLAEPPFIGADVRVNLFRGGRDGIDDSMREVALRRLTSTVRRVIVTEVEKAASSWWQIAYLKEREALLRKMIDLNQQNLLAAQRRIKSGVAADSDRFEFEIHKSSLERELALTSVQSGAEKRLLRTYLGLDEGVAVDVDSKLSHDHDFENKLKFDVQQVEYLFADHAYKSEEDALMAKASSREWWPRFDAYIEYEKSAWPDAKELGDARQNENGAETTVGVSVSLNLPAGMEGVRESRALLARSSAGRLLAEAGKQETLAHLENEIAQLRFLHGQVHEAEQNIARAERYYRSTQSEYARGVKNSPDVLGASQKLFEMHHDRLEITKNFEVAKSHVLAKISN